MENGCNFATDREKTNGKKKRGEIGQKRKGSQSLADKKKGNEIKTPASNRRFSTRQTKVLTKTMRKRKRESTKQKGKGERERSSFFGGGWNWSIAVGTCLIGGVRARGKKVRACFGKPSLIKSSD